MAPAPAARFIAFVVMLLLSNIPVATGVLDALRCSPPYDPLTAATAAAAFVDWTM